MLIPIIFFSSSNNTAYVAKLIALGLGEKGFQTQLIPIQELKTGKHNLTDAKVLGVGAPIYGGFAEPIKNWAKNFDFAGKRVFLFSTAGIWHFGSTAEMISLIEKQNGRVIGAFEMTFRGCMDGIVYSKRLSESHPIKKTDIERAVAFGYTLAHVLENSKEYVDSTTGKHIFGAAFLTLIRVVKLFVLKLFKVCLYITDSDKCVGCMKCTKICPSDAVKIQNKSPSINYHLCISCCRCFKDCPTKALSLRFFGDRQYYHGPWMLRGYIDPEKIIAENSNETL
ncbi:MAG: EFR1 family ferrodoxin [Candidatus Bathyarchaeota archaeon]|nr:EFR1 family ferrodoxin [Candidatus Bathyarchaeota archaeon]